MTDVDTFERDLLASLRSYASEAPTVGDPAAFALAIALEHQRRRAWLHRPAIRTMGWILLGAALLLATVIALGVTGGGRLPSDPLLGSRNPMPDELFGVRTAGGYSLDVNDEFLIRGPGGEPLTWAGTAVEFVPRIGEVGDLVIHAAGPCGEGRYSIRTGSPPEGGIPGPSASGGNPTPLPGLTPLDLVGQGSPFVLIPVSDACAGRFEILTAGPWEPKSVELVAAQRYDSMDFTEPFEFVMPPTGPGVPNAVARFWGKGIFRVANGYSWTSFFLDDLRVPADVCDASRGTLTDIPATPDEVGGWLRGGPKVAVSNQRELIVDGRTALSFDIEIAEGCDTWAPPLESGEFYYGFRVYAIPTGDDTILFSPWSDEGSFPFIDSGADELVRSMRFR